jgi:hypothetical protein
MSTTIATAQKGEKLRAYLTARRKGIDWLLGHLNPDGSLGDPTQGFQFYRAPWTFAMAGETAAASAVCGWIRRNMLTPSGTIEGPYRVFNEAWTYRNATLIVGTHLAMQYDLSHGLMRDLLSWQDPVSGGFADDRLPDGTKSDTMDIPYACGAGFACLQTGHLDASRQVYRFLDQIYEAQTELPDRFFYTWSRSKQAPIKEYPPERRTKFVVENQLAARQRWTIGGISAGFLGRLYLVEPRPEYLALARKYQAFSMRATDRQFDYAHVCKSSWGSSLLYQITGEEQYLNWTYRMGDWYVETQQPDGHWHWDYCHTLGDHLELTLEFVMHVDTLIAGLASRPEAKAQVL